MTALEIRGSDNAEEPPAQDRAEERRRQPTELAPVPTLTESANRNRRLLAELRQNHSDSSDTDWEPAKSSQTLQARPSQVLQLHEESKDSLHTEARDGDGRRVPPRARNPKKRKYEESSMMHRSLEFVGEDAAVARQQSHELGAVFSRPSPSNDEEDIRLAVAIRGTTRMVKQINVIVHDDRRRDGGAQQGPVPSLQCMFDTGEPLEKVQRGPEAEAHSQWCEQEEPYAYAGHPPQVVPAFSVPMMGAGVDQAQQAAPWDHGPEPHANWFPMLDAQGPVPEEAGPQEGLRVASEAHSDRPNRLAVPDTRMKQSDHDYNPQQPFLRVDFDCLDLLSQLGENRIPIAREDTSHYIQMQFPDAAFHSAMRLVRDWGTRTSRGVFVRKQPFRTKHFMEVPAEFRDRGPSGTGPQPQRPRQPPQQHRQSQQGYDFGRLRPAGMQQPEASTQQQQQQHRGFVPSQQQQQQRRSSRGRRGRGRGSNRSRSGFRQQRQSSQQWQQQRQ